MSRSSEHTCHALACDTNVPPRMHMCGKHWRMVPKPLQDALWANYRRGQERTLTPSIAYLLAAADCVEAVARKEGYADNEIAEERELYETWASMLESEDSVAASVLPVEAPRASP